MSLPAVGDVVWLGRAASVQFDGDRAVTLRVTSVDRAGDHDRWAWLTGYALDRRGRAVARREVYVRLAGLRLLHAAPPSATRVPGPRRAGGRH